MRRFTTRLAEWLGGEEEVTVLHVMSQLSAGPGVRGQQLRAEAEAVNRPFAVLAEEDLVGVGLQDLLVAHPVCHHPDNRRDGNAQRNGSPRPDETAQYD